MRSPWIDATALIDAGTLSLWSHTGRRPRCPGAADVVVAHSGHVSDALSSALAGLPKARLTLRNRLSIVVGHPWAHGVVLPWQDGLSSDAAWRAYAGMRFAERAQRGALRILIAHERWGRTRLAAGICEGFLMEITRASRAAGWRLASVRDALSASLDAYPAWRDRDDFAFALRQQTVATCAFRHGGQWRDVVTLPCDGDWFAAAALMAGLPACADIGAVGFDGALLGAGIAAVELMDRSLAAPA
ncbi:hypothetical protein [Burkholderia sp. 22PA0106]|uniref:hypothetical protein n=1 Tax=Burkholderia sp. 22PA0106 TaxID=3237371 RepID=UPI0039C3FB18